MTDAITFQSLGLSEPMLRALEEKGYGYPTSVQKEAIPPLMEWKDVIAKAPTGSKKIFQMLKSRLRKRFQHRSGKIGGEDSCVIVPE